MTSSSPFAKVWPANDYELDFGFSELRRVSTLTNAARLDDRWQSQSDEIQLTALTQNAILYIGTDTVNPGFEST